jgi:hypothetical protein
MPVMLEIDALDFERLHETSMEMSNDWLPQIKDGRFDYNEGFQYKQMYWFENYVSCKLAGSFLDAIKEAYTINFDGSLGQYIILTDYVVA